MPCWKLLKTKWKTIFNLKVLLTLLLTTGLFHAATQQVFPSVQANRGRIVMVVIDKMSLEDYLSGQTPEIEKLIQKGSLGLMLTNVASGYPRAASHTYATLGAGVKLSGGYRGGQAFGADETIGRDRAGDQFYRNTGYMRTTENMVHLGLVPLINDNIKSGQQDMAGALGTWLGLHGLKTAVIGNADLPLEKDPVKRYGREAASIAMNGKGIVDRGDIGPGCYKTDIRALAGVSTNYDHLLAKVDQYRNQADFLVIETGDISRIEALKNLSPKETYLEHRRQALTRIDEFLGALSKKLDYNRDLLVIISPGPSDDALEKGNWLTPVVMAGKDIQKGILASGTTKEAGLVSNTDMAPTLLAFWDIKPQHQEGPPGLMTGQVMFTQPAEKPEAHLKNLNDRAVYIHNARYPLVKIFINGAFVLLIISLLLLKAGKMGGQLIKPLWVGITVMPLLLFVSGRIFIAFNPMPSITAAAAALAFMTALLTAGIIKFCRGTGDIFRPFLISGLLMLLLLLVDTLTGTPLGKTSPLSYDVMAGARFYGIGNEYMGILIGAALSMTAMIFDLKRMPAKQTIFLVAIWFGLIFVSIASPLAGANLGGAIASSAGFCAALLIIFNRPLQLKHFLGMGFGVCFMVIALFYFDSGRLLEAQTHMGRTAALIHNGGLGELYQVIVRKLAVNYKLIKYTTWSWFYFLSFIIIVWGYKFFPGAHALFEKNHPWFNKIKTAALTGSVFALLFNDSGVVAAATCILYTAGPYLYGLLYYGSLKERT